MLRSTARRAATVLALILVLGPLSTFVATSASAQTVASKQAEANRIAAQLDKLSERASILTEDYNEARLKAATADQRSRSAAADLVATTAKAKVANDALKKITVSAYIRGGLDRPRMGSQGDPARAQYYIQSATNRQKDAIDSLRAAKLSLSERQAGLDAARVQARKVLDQVNAKKKAAMAAEAEQRQLLAKVKGDLARLVDASRNRNTTRTGRQPRTSRNGTFVAPAGSFVPAPNPSAGAAVEEARRQIGKPYQYGGSGPGSFDCSGLTSWAWRHAGKSLPHSSRAQYSATSRVGRDQIAPGDLVFFGRSVSGIHHVGIYAGGGYMIDAPETGRNVQYVPAFRSDLVGIGRVN